jgi:hypothetical protein
MDQRMGKWAKDKKSAENKKDCNANIEAVNVGTARFCVSNGVSGNKRCVVSDNENCGESSQGVEG